MPKISVVMPVYNGKKYLKKSIQSVLQQTEDDFELLIYDDCSTDNSIEIIKSFSDDRISFFYGGKNKGIFYGINRLIKESKSPLIHLWSQDDMMCNNCLEEFCDFHGVHKNIAFSFSGNYVIDENDRVIRKVQDSGNFNIMEPKDSIPIFLIYGCLPGNISRVVLNKQILLKEGLFREDFAFIGDFEMWVRLSSKYNIGIIRKALQKIRNHQLQASKRDDMYIKKLHETRQLYKIQVEQLLADDVNAGINVINWVHLPHFALISVNFIKSLKLKCFIDYSKALAKLDNLGLIYLRSFVFVCYSFFGMRKKYLNRYFKPFQKHIDIYENTI